MIKYYLMEMFEPTLLYGLSLAVLGTAAAFHYGYFSLLYAVLVIIGTVLAQMSVNVISDYFDYSSGLDRELVRKKSGELSGGSSLLADGLIKPKYTLVMGHLIFLAAGLIGVYLLYVRIQVLPILIIAVPSILLYAKYVKRIPYLSEPLCTFNYTLIAFGSFVVVSGIYALSYGVAFAFVPAGILLGGDALFVNEVPDRTVDKKYGVKHSAVMLGTSKKIGLYYLAFQSLAYVIMVVGIFFAFVPVFALACLLTLPTTFYVFKGLYSGNSKKYASYLKMHTISSFVFALILSLSYLIIMVQ